METDSRLIQGRPTPIVAEASFRADASDSAATPGEKHGDLGEKNSNGDLEQLQASRF